MTTNIRMTRLGGGRTRLTLEASRREREREGGGERTEGKEKNNRRGRIKK